MKRAGLAVLFLLAGLLSAEAAPVKGVVRCGKRALAGVVVTDGTSFATTNRRGAFSIELSPEADFVYIFTPSGYSARVVDGVPRFFRAVEPGAKYDFNLQQLHGKSFALLAVGDPQIRDENHMNRFRNETIVDMKSLADSYRARGVAPVGLVLGDMVWDAMQYYKPYTQATGSLGFPFYPLIGNHDHNRTLKGDHATSANYRSYCGPENYGFDVGGVHVIVLDNVIYDTDKKFVEDLTPAQIDWVRRYAALLPAGSQVCVAMHCPLMKYFMGNHRMPSGERLLAALEGHKVSLLTGHTHINSNLEVAPGVIEYNVASAGGAWWLSQMSKDGTPCGYQVFEIDSTISNRYYKSTGHPASYQMVVYDRGEYVLRPNDVVAKIWDWDAGWKVEWWQDDRYMGTMEQFTAPDPAYSRVMAQERLRAQAAGEKIGKYRTPIQALSNFAAHPSADARQIRVVATDSYGKRYEQNLRLSSIDVQAHRGGIGLMPENTIPAMINAVRLGVNTLEMDLQISKDGYVVVSHDNYMNPKFVTCPDGSSIDPAQMRSYALYNMTYDSIARYDTGLRPHPDFPGQKKLATHKPLLSELIDSVENFVAREGFSPVNYNIEIKSLPKYDNKYAPAYDRFTELAMSVLLSKNLGERLLIQCFDVRTLNYLHDHYPQVRLSYLVDAKQPDTEANIARLGFVPEWYSPHYSLVNEQSVALWHGMGMKIVPWTPDSSDDIGRMVELGVDAIISNYPDRVLEITRKY